MSWSPAPQEPTLALRPKAGTGRHALSNGPQLDLHKSRQDHPGHTQPKLLPTRYGEGQPGPRSALGTPSAAQSAGSQRSSYLPPIPELHEDRGYLSLFPLFNSQTALGAGTPDDNLSWRQSL